jgi:hypothetical protein
MSEAGGERPGWPGATHEADRGGGTAREAALARAFVRLADTLARDFDIVEFLHGLTVESVEILAAETAGSCWPTRAASCG